MWCYYARLSLVDIRSGVFHYSAMVVFNEVYAIVAEIARMKVGVFEKIYLQIP
jgi:hypothetical protein